MRIFCGNNVKIVRIKFQMIEIIEHCRIILKKNNSNDFFKEQFVTKHFTIKVP